MFPTAGTDYVLRNEPVNFPVGQNESVITIGIQDDSTYEGNEVFIVRLVDARVGGVTITRNEAEVVIEDDDGESSPSHNFRKLRFRAEGE